MKRFAAAALIAGLGAGTAQAASIAWSVFDITGNVSDISNNGTFVSAVGGSALTSALAVGGVTFADASNLDPDPNDLFEETRSVSLPSGFDTDYQTLLLSSTRDRGGTASITFSGLTAGLQYEIQVWVADDRTANAGVVVSDGVQGSPTIGQGGNATLLLTNSANDDAGQYAIGVFTADSSTQSFSLGRYTNIGTTNNGPGNQVIVNAVQLRQVPEPGSLALLGLGGLLIGARRRRA